MSKLALRPSQTIHRHRELVSCLIEKCSVLYLYAVFELIYAIPLSLSSISGEIYLSIYFLIESLRTRVYLRVYLSLGL